MLAQKYRGFIHGAKRAGLVAGVHAGEQILKRGRFAIVSKRHGATVVWAASSGSSAIVLNRAMSV